MIKTKHAGMKTAIKEWKRFSLIGELRAIHEEKLKIKRDRWAMDEYVRLEGHKAGFEEGETKKLITQICRKLEKGMYPGQIAEALEEDYPLVKKISEAARACGLAAGCDVIYRYMKEKERMEMEEKSSVHA